MSDNGYGFWDDDPTFKGQTDSAPSVRSQRSSNKALMAVTGLAIGLIIAGLVWIWNEQSTFRLNVVFERGNGLSVDSPVYVRGARVGRVSQLRFDTAGKILATLAIRRDAADHLYDSSVFYVALEQYVSGPACISVYTPSDGLGRRLRAGDTVAAVSGIPQTLVRVVLPWVEDTVIESQGQIRRMKPSLR